MTAPFTLKTPDVYDISGNDPGTPLSKVFPLPHAMMVRGTLARYYSGMPWTTYSVEPDELAAKIFAETRELSTLFTAYAYILQGKMDKQIDCFVQAMKDAGIIVGGKWQAEMPPVADVEVECEAKAPRNKPKWWIPPIKGTAWAAQIKYWLDAVEAEASVIPMIYTAKPQWVYLCDNAGNPPAWTNRYRFWVKFYPFTQYIDANPTLPVSALPNGVKMEQVDVWQYNDAGRQNKFNFNDLNVMTAEGLARYKKNDTHEQPPIGGGEVPAVAWKISEQSDSRIVLERK